LIFKTLHNPGNRRCSVYHIEHLFLGIFILDVPLPVDLSSTNQDLMGNMLKNQISQPGYNTDPPQLYLETYGCQMNVADSEIVISIMQENGYALTREISQADIVLINTCSVRENAEQRIWRRLDTLKKTKGKKPDLLVGIIGCMAERLKEKLLTDETGVDLVIGPDAYRDQ
jgi:hypothetical protein